MHLDLHKFKLLFLGVSTFLLFSYSAFSIWFPHNVESQYQKTRVISLDERVSIIEKAIETAKEDSRIDRDKIIEALQASIESEKSDDHYISRLVSLFTTVSGVLMGIIIVHFASLILVFHSLSKRKT